MPELGRKFDCFRCRTKFYNLGKPEAICPKCGANQKDAKAEEAPSPPPRPSRRSAVLMEPIPEENADEFGEEVPSPEEEAVAEQEGLEEEEGEVSEPSKVEEEEEY